MTEDAREMPVVRFNVARGEQRISLTGAWWPKRDDVQGVIALRKHLSQELPIALYSARDGVFLDVYVTGDIDLDRALSGAMTALDGQHGNIQAALWDDGVIRQARVTRLGAHDALPR